MTTYLDYAGRTVDVLAFRGQTAQGEARLAQSLADDESGGEVCAGAQMVAQAWALQFLTEQGSVAYAPTAGGSFMVAARQGRLLTETDVFQQFNLAAAQVRRTLRAAEAPADPADERFESAALTRVAIAPGSVSLYVTVRTAAGTERQVVLPLPLVV